MGTVLQAEGTAALEALRQERAWYRKTVHEDRAAQYLGGGGGAAGSC